MPFYVHNRGSSGEGSCTPYAELSGKSISVAGMTLDRFLEQEKIEMVHFIKIDVEGHELELLEGARQSLTERRLKKIYIEFNGSLQMRKGNTFKTFVQYFADYGYRPQNLNQELFLKLSRQQVDPEKVVTDFLFAPI